MTFRENEKFRYKTIKPKLFSKEAQEPGTYKKKARSFCLADGYSAENLHESIRDEAITYFKERHIPWHEGFSDGEGNKKTLPSNHLCCSPCMCVNCLAPMMRDRQLLAKVFKPFLQEISEVLPFTADQTLSDGSQPYLSFEFVGEKIHFELEKAWPQRGTNCTSLDFSFLFRRSDGRRQLVLGEWKYTEEYRSLKLPKKDKINQTQWNTYKEEFEIWKSRQPDLPDYEHFFVEPFYQLMRQTLLAQKMEREKELDADIVVHVHVSPKANREFADTFTSPIMAKYGSIVTEAWKNLAPNSKFISINSEDLLAVIDNAAKGSHRPWADWLIKRYGWWSDR
jgi:hypothetical protein